MTILDNELIPPSSEKKSNSIEWIIPIVFWVGLCLNFLNGFNFYPKFNIALISILISTLVYIINYKMGVVLFLLSGIIGIFELGHFFPVVATIELHLILYFKIEVIMTIITMVHFVINRKVILSFINLENTSEDQKRTDALNQARIDYFKVRFSKKAKSEIQMILNNEKLVPDAREASRVLLSNEP